VAEYTTVLAQAFSPDGQLYCAGTAAGDLAVWRVSVLVGRGEKKGPVVVWKPHSNSAQRDVHSLATTEGFLLTGGRGEVRAWGREEINQGNVGQPQWALQVPGGGEVNSMLVMGGGTAGRLVVGTGDNNVYVFDLETRQLSSTLAGHTDYIHYVAAGKGEGDTLASASEDGTVRLWDQRKKEEVNCLTPGEQSTLARPHLGKHISCAAVSSEWLVCGGGPRLALWHLRTLSPSVTLPPIEVEAKTVAIHDDTLICSGRKVVYQTNFTGEVTAEVDVSSATIYSLAWQDHPSASLLAIAGSSRNIDICTTNFNYRDATVQFPILAT